MEEPPQPSKLLGKVINLILSEDELKLPTETKVFKELRNSVKNFPQIISPLILSLFIRFEKWDPTTRHSALLICDYFFHRSHQFRLEIIEKMPKLLELVCESNPIRKPLPPPMEAAKLLKVTAIKFVKAWYDKFHDGYKHLDFIHHFLTHSKSIDYEQATAAVEAERLAKEQKTQKAARQNALRVEKAMEKVENVKNDIQRNLIEVENGLRILVPTFGEEDDIPGSSQGSMNGISDGITVVLKAGGPEVRVTDDNEAVVEAVKDSHTMLTGFLKFITNQMSILQKYGANQQQITEVLELKTKLSTTIAKIEELKLSRKRKKKTEDESDSEESDLEDVPEKQLEDFVTPYEVPKYILERIAKDSEDQPCCSKSLRKREEKEEKKKSEIPTLAFGLDLKYWGEERGQVQAPRNNFDGHRFWRPPDDEEKTTQVEASIYETRVITYIGEELRPKKECRTRLANGQLCPRRDKTKCPIHGIIVDRDEEGFPLKETPETIELVAKSLNAQEEDEEEFIRDVEMATGKDLSGKKKKKAKNRYVPHVGKVVRERLEKKLWDKRTLKRVGDTLDAIQKARIEKKHGSQFVHALNR